VYRFLLRPRWIVLTLLVVLAVPVCIRLGQWQWHRYQVRHAANEVMTRNLAAPPIDVRQLTGPERDLDEQDRWRTVTATGRYDAGHELLARNRSLQGRPGFYVVTPLITSDGSAVLVNRGWVGLAESATVWPDAPPPPPGQVTVTGRIRPSETRHNSGIREHSGAPEGQIYRISAQTISRRLPYPLDRAIVELTAQQPAAASAPEPVDPPGEAHEWMNLSYAVQWNLFAALAPVGWMLLVWQEARSRRREDEAQADSGSEQAEPDTDRPDAGLDGRQRTWPAGSKTMR
jgi:cytochrome oxidase assembly protein ShyY1